MTELALRGSLTDAAFQLAEAAMAPATRAAYRADWTLFQHWCQSHDVRALPADPAAVANYVAEAAVRLAPATIARQLAAINKVHAAAGLNPPGAHPTVATVMSGLRRSAARPPRRMRPLVRDGVVSVIEAMDRRSWPAGIASARDACLLLFGFAGAFRRSELVAIDVGHVLQHPKDGLHIRILRSKTDQEGVGMIKALPYGASPSTCPVCVWHRWIELRIADRAGQMAILLDRETGHICRERAQSDLIPDTAPAFVPIRRNGELGAGRLSGQAVNDMVQRRVSNAGLGDSGFGSHSMRAGFVVQAIEAGATDRQIARQTGHRSMQSITVYDRENRPLRGNAVTRLGL